MQELEAEASDSMFVILSNVHLDQPKVHRHCDTLIHVPPDGDVPIRPNSQTLTQSPPKPCATMLT